MQALFLALVASCAAVAQGLSGGFGGGAAPRGSKFRYDQQTLSAANRMFAEVAAALEEKQTSLLGKRERLSWSEVVSGSSATIADVYVRGPGSDKLWFAGKVAAGSGFPKGAFGGAWAQRSLVFEHARRLRPIELGAPGVERSLELFCAVGNSELAVVQDEERLYRCNQEAFEGLDLPKKWAEVAAAYRGAGTALGFQPEFYEPEEKGFYTIKGEDGENLGPPVKINIQKGPPPA